jgi:hypothetical protein
LPSAADVRLHQGEKYPEGVPTHSNRSAMYMSCLRAASL